jgi:hypothetical protein
LTADPSENGLWCGEEGLSLSRQALLRKTKTGFVPKPLLELQKILDDAYGAENKQDAGELVSGLASVARSLNKGDLPLAMISSVMLKLPEIAAAQPAAKFDPAQPRDEDGRWTEGAGTEAKQTPPIGLEGERSPSLVDLETEATSTAERESIEAIAPRVIGLLGRFAGILSGPIALAVGLLIPTNRSNIHYGDLPGFPGLTFRSDEGVVTLSRLDADGNVENLYHGLPDSDGYYHDEQGHIIGQHVGTGVLFDDDYLGDLSSKPGKVLETNTNNDPTTDANPASDDEQPKICPAPSVENIAGRSKRAIAYQSQITGLLPGFDMEYRTVRFDGCDEKTGRMMEAKGLGMAWMLDWPRDDLVKSKFYLKMMKQAGEQDIAATGRGDDYYFADNRMATFFEEEFRLAGYTNIKVHHVDAIVKKIEDCMKWIKSNLEHWWLTRQDSSQPYLLNRLEV